MKTLKTCLFVLLLQLLASGLLSQTDSSNSPGDSINLKLKDSKNSSEWFDDPSGNRMIIAPTGRTIKQGQVQLASMAIIPWAMFPTVHVGITDYINVGIGFSVPFGLIYIAPKVRLLKTGYTQLSAGMLFCPAAGSSQFSTFSIAYLASSIGTQTASLNLGIGYSFSKDFFNEEPIVQLGGEIRVGRGFKFISENWIIAGETIPVFSLGFRAFNENINFDALAVFTLSKDFSIPFYPLVSLGYNFDITQNKKLKRK